MRSTHPSFSSRKRNSFNWTSLFPLFVSAFIVLVIFGIVGNFVVNLPKNTKGRALESMKVWAEESHHTLVNYSCVPDTDDDGYASCSATVLRDNQGANIDKNLQCVSGWLTIKLGGSGCKEVTDRVQFQRRM